MTGSEAGLIVQARGLIAGAVDGILIETCQDTLQIKAAVNAAKIARKEAGADTPIFVQVTVETTGTLLVGPDIAAAATVIDALDIPLIGLNCATGPQEMSEHVKFLAENWEGFISLQPNAGLPELVDGQTKYPLSPEEMAMWVERFIAEDGVNLVGGCCGTTPAPYRGAGRRAAQARRQRPAPGAERKRSALWGTVGCLALWPDRAPPGERLFLDRRTLQRQWQQEMAPVAGEPMIGTAASIWGRSRSRKAPTRLMSAPPLSAVTRPRRWMPSLPRLTGAVTAPLVIDSTETPVIEAALKLYGGKPIINSINFEDGEKHAEDRLVLAKKFGCAVIALTIDEQGMSKTAEHKLAIARRLVDFACNKHGLPQADLMIDPLTFTIATGNEDDRKLGLETIEGIRPDPSGISRCADYSRPIEHLLRPQSGGAPCVEFGVPRPCGPGRYDRRYRPCVEDRAAAPDPARRDPDHGRFDL